MERGARTPEELETLLEDTFLTRDPEALLRLFEDGAVLVPSDGVVQARGAPEIASFISTMWASGRTYVAHPRRIVQGQSTALVITDGGTAVLQRGSDHAWRYAIALLSFGSVDPRTQDDDALGRWS
jgi:Domain of unknown function (DUF4440)